jgi:hypothetical protein
VTQKHRLISRDLTRSSGNMLSDWLCVGMNMKQPGCFEEQHELRIRASNVSDFLLIVDGLYTSQYRRMAVQLCKRNKYR